MKRGAWILPGALSALLVLAALTGGGGGDFVSPLHDAGNMAAQNERGWLLDVNTATAGDLALLPGIGEELAARIVEYREENGSFAAIEDLMDVPGIGQKKFQAIQDLIGVS